MTIGDRIKNLRLALGMSQEELGEKIGVKKQAVYKYETGIVVNLKRSIIANLAVALQTSPAYLMGWIDDPSPESVSVQKEFVIPDDELSEKERSYIQKIKALSPEQQKLLDIFLTGLENQQ